MKIWIGSILLAAGTGCGGIRHVPPPANPQGYRPVELRDVAPTGMKDVNVQLEVVVAASGLSALEDCDLVTIDTMGMAPPAAGDAAAIAAWTASMPGFNTVTLTLPRARYDEVRNLRPFDRVRVQGYLSNYWGKGCGDFTTDAHRFLWIDTIRRIDPTDIKY